jgi:hypothetical protein
MPGTPQEMEVADTPVCYDSPHLTNETTKAQTLGNLPNVTWSMSDSAEGHGTGGAVTSPLLQAASVRVSEHRETRWPYLDWVISVQSYVYPFLPSFCISLHLPPPCDLSGIWPWPKCCLAST